MRDASSFRNSFDFCQAAEGSGPSENLGQVVFGERIRPSPYNVRCLYNCMHNEPFD